MSRPLRLACKGLVHDRMVSFLKENSICLNCLRPGHFVRQCKSPSKCKKCQRPHHTLLHVETRGDESNVPQGDPVPSHATIGLSSSSLLLTCEVRIDAPDGSSVKARALLDSASSASFISERLAQSLSLPHSPHSARISGVGPISLPPTFTSQRENLRCRWLGPQVPHTSSDQTQYHSLSKPKQEI